MDNNLKLFINKIMESSFIKPGPAGAPLDREIPAEPAGGDLVNVQGIEPEKSYNTEYQLLEEGEYLITDTQGNEDVLSKLQGNKMSQFSKNRRWNTDLELSIQKYESSINEIIARLDSIEKRLQNMESAKLSK